MPVNARVVRWLLVGLACLHAFLLVFVLIPELCILDMLRQGPPSEWDRVRPCMRTGEVAALLGPPRECRELEGYVWRSDFPFGYYELAIIPLPEDEIMSVRRSWNTVFFFRSRGWVYSEASTVDFWTSGRAETEMGEYPPYFTCPNDPDAGLNAGKYEQ